MPAQETQYHHYIPRFILKHFAHDSTCVTTRDSKSVLHVFDVASRQFHLSTVGKTCGRQNLYCNPEDINSMRIEELLSKLESQAAEVFARVHAAVANGENHIDIREEHIRVVFKFFNVSLRRTSQYRDEVQDPCRENDFMFQSMFETSNNGRQPVSPSQFWLDNLRYLLESDHDDLFAATNAAADTYKHFFQTYALQIWKAAKGHEFFLNERFVDFEGETQSYLGTEATETGHQLIWMTTDDMIHLILPISPEVAIVLCDESRCWESPFAEILHELDQPYPQNSLLKNAPHKDIIEVELPSVKRGRTAKPATTAWRVNIAALSDEHHRVITSYTLGHASSLIVVRGRKQFECAKKHFDLFGERQSEKWKEQGIRHAPPPIKRRHDDILNSSLGLERVEQIGNHAITALTNVMETIQGTAKPFPRTKENAIKCWLAVHVLGCSQRLWEAPEKFSNKSGIESGSFCNIHPAVRAAFEAAYPAKPPQFRDLITLDFEAFINEAIGEEKFAQLSHNIESKTKELVDSEAFETHWETSGFVPQRQSEPSLSSVSNPSSHDDHSDDHWVQNAAFRSMFRLAQGLEIMRWMYEQRQDILACFVHKMAVPMKDLRPPVIRFRARRE